MSEMDLNESCALFSNAMKEAADSSRKLGRAQKDKGWLSIANTLDDLRRNTEALYKTRELSRADALALAEREMSKIRT